MSENEPTQAQEEQARQGSVSKRKNSQHDEWADQQMDQMNTKMEAMPIPRPLPRADGGWRAWTVLLAAFVVQATIWGKSYTILDRL